jgi:bla regulator protein blaR1
LLLAISWMAMAASSAFGQPRPVQVVDGGSAAQAPKLPQWQIAAGVRMAFEVASIKQTKTFRPPNIPLNATDYYSGTGGRFAATAPLWIFIQFAYKLTLTSDQTQSMLKPLPKWVATDLFEVEARAEGKPTKDQMRLMMQSLLADRFKLAIHFEDQPVPVFALTLVKPGKIGPKLLHHEDGPSCDIHFAPAPSDSLFKATDVFPLVCKAQVMRPMPSGMRLAGARNTTLELIAGSLPSLARLGRPVVDRTGLSGRFDYQIEWTPDPDILTEPDADVQSDSLGATFVAALRDQLGLKLGSTNGQIRTPIIDHVEHPSEN